METSRFEPASESTRCVCRQGASKPAANALVEGSAKPWNFPQKKCEFLNFARLHFTKTENWHLLFVSVLVFAEHSVKKPRNYITIKVV
ncbi:MAG: hypothetical protein MI923_07845 [Phycisphaerales bacterium]|nr:hypothetical protein [Phycisphaerales bacterium]